MFDWTVVYGYRTYRAIFGLLAIILVGWGIFAWASWDHLRATKSAGQLPDYAPWLYSIDSVLPVINLGQEAAWSPTGCRPGLVCVQRARRLAWGHCADRCAYRHPDAGLAQ